MPGTLQRSVKRIPFVHDLHKHGQKKAIVDSHGEALTYAELAERIEDTARLCGDGRRLVLIVATSHIDTLVVYLACLHAGHVPLLVENAPETITTMIETWDPDTVYHEGITHRRHTQKHTLHSDLALLLSTSGSTGSPKLVRLSAENLCSNAEAITAYLGIRETDRPVLSLPLHYCYGLSIVHSNLARGATLLSPPGSLTDETFWEYCREHGATSFHGVPHSFELIESAGDDVLTLPTLRYVTQAGGRMPPHRVRAVAEQGERYGWDLYVMYGQTEATARMAYLPPELAREHPSCVGIPIPGGSFTLRGGGREGELLYSGPNVMLGYAQTYSDLAEGRTIDVLETGDTARRTSSGLYEITGRTRRFIKICGLRIDLDHIQRLLEERGDHAVVSGTDDTLAVAVLGSTAGVQQYVRQRTGVPPSALRVFSVEEFPRLATGKYDYARIVQLAHEQHSPTSTKSVKDVYESVLGVNHVRDTDTFAFLGGDSLSYVEAHAALEKLIGELPSEWEKCSVASLEELRDRNAEPHPPRKRSSRVETSIVLRAVAAVFVVTSHLDYPIEIVGGAHLLLILAGWGFARFALTEGPSHTLRTAARIVVPAVVWIALMMWVRDDVTLANVLLLNTHIHTGTSNYWFIEVLVQLLLIAAVVLSIPAARRVERARPLLTASCVLLCAVALTPLTVVVGYPGWHLGTQGIAWFFVLGWVAYRVVTWWQKALVAAVGVWLISGFFGDPTVQGIAAWRSWLFSADLGDPVREIVPIAGLIVLLSVRHIHLPQYLVRIITILAASSLFLYLTQFSVYPVLLEAAPLPVVFVTTVAVGVVVWWGVEFCTTYVKRHRKNRKNRVSTASLKGKI